MLRTYRRIFRATFACALLLLGGLFSLEGVIADVHEGQAARAGVVVEMSAAPSHSSVPVDGHGMHLCHCLHAHTAVQASVMSAPTSPTLLIVAVPSTAHDLLTSRTIGPALRPPIA